MADTTQLTSEASREASSHAIPHWVSVPSQLETFTHLGSKSTTDVYDNVVAQLIPAWLRVIGSSPWIHVATLGTRLRREAPSKVHVQQAAACALGLIHDRNPEKAGGRLVADVVRASLVRWQCSLRSDGRPIAQRHRTSPWLGATAGYVVTLLSETHGFQKKQLLADLERHLHWLSRRRVESPWLEAAAIDALADGAVLVRDASLREAARSRLTRLLARHDSGGWFPQDGGADVGLTSLTVDHLARIYLQHGWDELRAPLARSLQFLLNCIHPDGSTGACCSTMGVGLMSSYGPESLASIFPEAAHLAHRSRQSLANGGGVLAADVSDNLRAVFGVKLGMLQTIDKVESPQLRHGDDATSGAKRYPRADITVHSNDHYHAVVNAKKGGAVHVAWKRNKTPLDDPGVTVVFRGRVKTSGRFDPHTRVCVDGSAVVSQGHLQSPFEKKRWNPAMLFQWFRRLMGGTFHGEPRVDVEHPADLELLGQRLKRSHFRREITFGSDWIRIHDIVSCPLPCETVICQSNLPAGSADAFPLASSQTATRPPIFIEGGRHVEIIRLYRDGELQESV